MNREEIQKELKMVLANFPGTTVYLLGPKHAVACYLNKESKHEVNKFVKDYGLKTTDLSANNIIVGREIYVKSAQPMVKVIVPNPVDGFTSVQFIRQPQNQAV